MTTAQGLIFFITHLLKFYLRDSLPQNQKYIFSFLPVVLFINLDSFGVSCFEISSGDFCLGAPSPQKIHLKNSTVMSLSRNHDHVTQNDYLD